MLGIKEELSGLIGELKNDVDDKGTKIEEDRKAQEAAFEALNNELKEIKEEFKAEGASSLLWLYILLIASVFSEGEQGELVGCSEPVERGDLRQAGRDEQKHRPGEDSKTIYL